MDIVDSSSVDWSGRREDSFENAKSAFSPAVLFREGYSTSCGSSGTGEIPQELSSTRRMKCVSALVSP
jgi:hypothetical protein